MDPEPATPQPLHIAHLTSVHEAFDTRIFHKECCTLAQAGYRVTLVAVHTGDEERDGVEIVALRAFGARWLRMLLTPLELLVRAVRLNADVYQFHDPELLGVGLILRGLGRKVVYDVHEDVPLTILSKPYLHPRVRGPLSQLARLIHRGADRLVSATVVVTPDVGKAFHQPVMVRNYPLLSEFAEPGPSYQSRPETCVYLGAITDLRGATRMREAVEIAGWDGERQLVLAGAMRDDDLGAALAHPGGLAAIDYVGILDRDGVQDLLHQARVGVFVPQPANLGYLTAYPIKLFEYMAAGIPVIMSDFPVLRGIVDGAGCGLCVDPGDPQALADAMTWLLDHPDEAEAMGRRGRKAVEDQYNFGSEGQTLSALYQRLCS